MNNAKNNVIYIAGPITNDPDYMEKFQKVAERVEELGYIPLVPTVLPSGMHHEQYMTICLPMVKVAAMVVFLPDWQDSIGAMMENYYCDELKKPWIRITDAWEKKVVNMMEVINGD